MIPGRYTFRGSRLIAWGSAFTFAMFLLFGLFAAGAGALTTVHVNVNFIGADTDDPPDTIDPGYTKDVADCDAELVSGDLVTITLENGYPSYTCTFTVVVQNTGLLPVRLDTLQFDVPPVLTVTDVSGHGGIVLDGGERDTETFTVHVEQAAAQSSVYTFSVRKPFRLYAQGTPGFWKNWDSHNTFTEAEIEGWLAEIDATSRWLGPTTVEGMESIMDRALGPRATPRDRFLGHYLATRLNERSGILDGADPHDVTGEDPRNYLGLANPSAAPLNQIIAAIEARFGTSPTKAQFNIMKDVCDALNNLET